MDEIKNDRDGISFLSIHIALFIFTSFSVIFFIHILGVDNEKVVIKSIDYFLLIIVVPLLETLFFQKIPIDYLLKEKRYSMNLIILGTGVLFTIFHIRSFDNLVILFPIFISGIYLSFIYLRLRERNFHPFLGTFIPHALFNVLGLLIT